MKSSTQLFSAVLLCVAVLGITFIFSQRTSATPLHAPVIVATAADQCNNKGGFFGLEPWYHFMPDELYPPPNCGIHCFNILIQGTANECGQTNSDIPGVFLAVIDDLLRVAGLLAVGFIIVGSFQYVGSRGNPERTAQAQSTVISALTGLAIALVAVAFVSFIGSKLQ